MMSHIKRLALKMETRLNNDQRGVFIHVPKCGGTSISAALLRYYPLSRSRVEGAASFRATRLLHGFDDTLAGFDQVLRFREHLLLYHLSQGRPFVTGHCPFSEIAYATFRDSYKFITVLRHPVSRFLSAYFFNWTKTESSPWRITTDLASYVESEYGRNDGCQLVKFIGGVREGGSYWLDEAVEQAKENLENFAVVGILEDPDGLVAQIRREFGFNIRLGRANPSPVSGKDREAVVNDWILEQIRRVCAPDLQLYDYARRMAAGSPKSAPRAELAGKGARQ